MSETRWMKEKNSKIRIGPEYQAVIPDLIVSKNTLSETNISVENPNSGSNTKNIHLISVDDSILEKKSVKSRNKEYAGKSSFSETSTLKIKSTTKVGKTNNKSRVAKSSIKQIKKN